MKQFNINCLKSEYKSKTYINWNLNQTEIFSLVEVGLGDHTQAG